MDSSVTPDRASRGGEPPRIPPLATDSVRPLLSVMIPSYRPSALLLETLRSILVQDPGPEVMQIEIVDDASPGAEYAPETWTERLAGLAPPGRIGVYRGPSTAGLAGNWNRCIERARGEYVHLLHQDDRVHPGFYGRLGAALGAHPEALMAFCRCDFIDGEGRPLGATRRRAWRAGIMRNWLARISEATRLQCPGALVPRRTYERLGGYRGDLRYALDWEMWVRIAAAGPVWYEPRILATYRKHRGNETTRLEEGDLTDADTLRGIGIFAEHLPPERRRALLGGSYREFVRLRLRHSARDADRLSSPRLRAQLELARRLMDEHPAAASWSNRLRLWRLERRAAAIR
jgi:GT2 family glycosyltransferase